MDNLNINSQNNVLTDNFLNLIQSNILILKQKKKVLLQYILKISDYPSTNLSVNSSNQFIEFLSFSTKRDLLSFSTSFLILESIALFITVAKSAP